jgi:small-conductance mechanosensitive channel
MADHALHTWIPADRLRAVLQPEPGVLILFAVMVAWVSYRVLLKALSPERHRRLRALFQNLLLHLMAAGAFLLLYWIGETALQEQNWYRLVPYLGLIALIWWAFVLVKIFRIYVFQYLFFMNMRTGVPVLIVNLLTLVLSLVLATWILGGVFNFHLGTLVATSAVFSIVLGLALQDTLGNLVAGVALQLDKPYEIGDWIEIYNTNNSQRFVGQVREITWRALNLISFTEETITIPNRMLAQAEIANFSGRDRPFLRSQIYRIPYGQPIAKVRELLLAAVREVPGVRQVPAPLVLFSESTESWMALKLVYSLHDFGAQFIVADQINTSVVQSLAEARIPIAAPRLDVQDVTRR